MKPRLHILPSLAVVSLSAISGIHGTTLYSIGEPTAKEQLYVELINRARANPTAEGIWLNSLNNNSLYPNIFAAYDQFSVNLTLMQSEFVTGSAAGKPTLNIAPPLAINSQITAAARLHAQDQIDNDFQGHHTGGSPSGNTGAQRMSAQGYTLTSWGENTFVASYDVLYGHAGFQVDWGGTDGTGMQGPPRGHRAAIFSPSFREIGVGNLTSLETTFPGSNTKAIGPEVCVQDFGKQPADTPFITGVAYYDLNGNSFYDIGEGIGGVAVTVTGASYHATTSASGGYTIPMSGNGSHTISFNPSFTPTNTDYSVSITGNNNLKQDLILTYSAPGIDGPSRIAVDDTSNFDIDLVPGASSYTWRIGLIDSTPTTEDGDQGSSGYATDVSAGYDVLVSTPSVTGNAFRLLDSSIDTSSSSPWFRDQILTLTRTFTPGASGEIDFKSRLTWQNTNQYAKVQVSEDDGATWQDTAFNQTGPGSSGESTFVDRNVDLSSYAGKSIMIRFNLNYTSGNLFGINPSSPTVAGWYIDNITFSDIEEINSVTTHTVSSGSSFSYTPTSSGSYRLSARANLPGGALPYGNDSDVIVVSSDFSDWLSNNPSATGGNSGDPELDGINNLLEYAFDLDPATSDAESLPQPTASATHITLSATYPAYDHSDLTYAIERSSTLEEGSWTTVKTFGPVEALSYSAALSSSTEYFYRWKITLNP